MMIVLVIALILIFLVVCWYISTGNRLHTLNVKLNTSETTLEAILIRRSGLVIQLLELCRNCPACAAHALPLLPPLHPGMSMVECNHADTQLWALARHIYTLAKTHPALYANMCYRELKLGIRDLEEQLQSARQRYNSTASVYNRLLTHFPSQAVGQHLHLAPRDLFQPDGTARQQARL